MVNAQEYQSVVCAGDTGMADDVQGWENSTFNWTVEGGVITRHYGDSIIVNWPMVPGEYTITVIETSEYGCVGTMQRALVLVAGSDLDLGGDTYVCTGETFEISPEGDYVSYLWHDGSNSPGYVTDQEGWIGLEVTDEYGCTMRDSLYLSILEVPEVDLGNDTTLCGDESLTLDAGPDGSMYTWSTGEISQQIEVSGRVTRRSGWLSRMSLAAAMETRFLLRPATWNSISEISRMPSLPMMMV